MSCQLTEAEVTGHGAIQVLGGLNAGLPQGAGRLGHHRGAAGLRGGGQTERGLLSGELIRLEMGTSYVGIAAQAP